MPSDVHKNAQKPLHVAGTRDVTDFESDFESDGFRHFFTNPNPLDLQTRFFIGFDY